jgi:hypothetical protein
MLQPWRGCSWLEVFGDHVLKKKAKSEGERQKKNLCFPHFFSFLLSRRLQRRHELRLQQLIIAEQKLKLELNIVKKWESQRNTRKLPAQAG